MHINFLQRLWAIEVQTKDFDTFRLREINDDRKRRKNIKKLRLKREVQYHHEKEKYFCNSQISDISSLCLT